MNCSKLCFLCSDSKTEFINLSQYHGTCGKHSLGAFITCIHCGSIVPIITIEVPDADVEIIDNKVQAILTIELKLDAFDRPQEPNESLLHKHFVCEPANKAEKGYEVDDQVSFEIIGPVDECFVDPGFKEFVKEEEEEEEEEKNKGYNEEKESGKCPFFQVLKIAPLMVLIVFAYVKRHGIMELSKSLFVGKRIS